ncbi:HsdM family class I SAM-dependent methyltransferase [Cetobacterium sp.]|uniref:HsdM family class I SAM-dependent methyltransferase n=1 Tax=Cetobacterium sp. TaxID=2071632 RepID=UPI003EE81716
MNREQIKKIIKKLTNYNLVEVEECIVKYYCELKNIDVLALDLRELKNNNKNLEKEIMEILTEEKCITNLEDLITLFENLQDNDDKKQRGVVYTPEEIKNSIIKDLILKPGLIIDPSCGCGSFLLTAIYYMNKNFNLSFHEIIGNYIYGIDVDQKSVDRTKLILKLLLLENKEIVVDKINIFCLDSLLIKENKELHKKFDYVIGNPPYVRIRNMEQEMKKKLLQWETVIGNTDLYIPFYEIGIFLLKTEGKLGYITPNTFLTSINGRILRKVLLAEKCLIKIINFQNEKIFGDHSNYTCIVILDYSKEASNVVHKIEYKESLEEKEITKISKGKFILEDPWILVQKEDEKNLDIIFNHPRKLGEYKIRNGIATLKNDLYIFKPIREDEIYYYRLYKEKEYKIEKNICIKIAKPNIIKTEKELNEKMEVAIFPYTYNLKTEKYEIIKEEILSIEYPQTYNYFLKNKEILLNRDKGKISKYPSWYAYGRTQGLNNQGKKLLIPYIADKGYAVKTLDSELIFYCGYALIEEDEKELDILKKIIESNVFEYYIKKVSKPYSKGYYSLAKNYLSQFPLPNISNEQKEKLLVLEEEELEKEICNLYNLSFYSLYNK